MDEQPHTPKKPWTIEKTAALLVIIVIVFFVLNALTNETDKLGRDVDETEQFLKCYDHPDANGCKEYLDSLPAAAPDPGYEQRYQECIDLALGSCSTRARAGLAPGEEEDPAAAQVREREWDAEAADQEAGVEQEERECRQAGLPDTAKCAPYR